jgi:hypothetical protein
MKAAKAAAAIPGQVEDTGKKWSQAESALKLDGVRESRPLRTPERVRYIIENTRSPEIIGEPISGRPGRAVGNCARVGFLKVVRPQSQPIVIRRELLQDAVVTTFYTYL